MYEPFDLAKAIEHIKERGRSPKGFFVHDTENEQVIVVGVETSKFNTMCNGKSYEKLMGVYDCDACEKCIRLDFYETRALIIDRKEKAAKITLDGRISMHYDRCWPIPLTLPAQPGVSMGFSRFLKI